MANKDRPGETASNCTSPACVPDTVVGSSAQTCVYLYKVISRSSYPIGIDPVPGYPKRYLYGLDISVVEVLMADL